MMWADETESCPPHHWVIEAPKGNIKLHGSCKKCEKVRYFSSTCVDAEFEPGFNQQVMVKPRKQLTDDYFSSTLDL